jgi:hypothetical protein
VANQARPFELSLLPIFLVRLRTLNAIAAGLNDLSQPSLGELRLLLERAEVLVVESMKQPISSECESGRRL